MSEFIRVRQIETGHQLSVPKSHADAAAGGYEVLDKPAVDSAGGPLPPKYHTTIAPAAAESSAPEGYAALASRDLKEEIAKRNVRRPANEWLSDKGNKAALVAVLEQDDAARASTAEPGTQTPAAPAADSQPPITDGHQADTPKENA
jgi:hypothetical protein